jgi:hypothetical protein
MRAEPCTHVLSAVFRDQPTEAPGFPYRVGLGAILEAPGKPENSNKAPLKTLFQILLAFPFLRICLIFLSHAFSVLSLGKMCSFSV